MKMATEKSTILKLKHINTKTEEKLIQELLSFGLTLVSHYNDYSGNTSNIEVMCKKGHLIKTTWKKLKTAKIKCRECTQKIKLDIESIREAFLKRGFILLETEYVNTTTKMRYHCTIHSDEIKYISLNNFQIGKGCKECGYDKATKQRQMNFRTVLNDFSDRGYILLSKHYKNVHQPLDFICSDHTEIGIQKTTYSNLKLTNHNCEICKEMSFKRGARHNNWNRSISTISEHLRKRTYVWRNASIKKCDGKCVLSGKDFEVVHHLYSFNKIVTETLTLLNFEVHANIKDHTPEEIYEIQKVCNQTHMKYGLGVCLTKEIHDLFHAIYGKQDSNQSQFEEFKKRYFNREFDEILLERSA